MYYHSVFGLQYLINLSLWFMLQVQIPIFPKYRIPNPSNPNTEYRTSFLFGILCLRNVNQAQSHISKSECKSRKPNPGNPILNSFYIQIPNYQTHNTNSLYRTYFFSIWNIMYCVECQIPDSQTHNPEPFLFFESRTSKNSQSRISQSRASCYWNVWTFRLGIFDVLKFF